jgi:hypothetical protein
MSSERNPCLCVASMLYARSDRFIRTNEFLRIYTHLILLKLSLSQVAGSRFQDVRREETDVPAPLYARSNPLLGSTVALAGRTEDERLARVSVGRTTLSSCAVAGRLATVIFLLCFHRRRERLQFNSVYKIK